MDWKLLIIGLLGLASANNIHNAVETEMFSIPISPNLFNWTYQEFDQQYRFHASLFGKPELPPWLRYIYSRRHHSGFIFGTPPRGTESPITLEVIGLNSADFETRRVLLTLQIKTKPVMATHEVELKIDNLNVEDLLDEHKMTRLKDILRTKLWTESHEDLYATFLASAIDLGARLPLKPSDGEGLVVRLGSVMPFSSELKRLREEVRPLSRLPSCPRDYKRTTVERLFRDAGLSLDWCRFELYNTIYHERSTEHVEYLTETPNTSKTGKSYEGWNAHDVWTAPSREDLPSRRYIMQVVQATIPPIVFMFLCSCLLGIAMCFENEFAAQKSGKVELCRYGTGNTDQTQVPDNTSSKSPRVSPNNSLVRPYSPKSTTNLAGSYNRPQPPPYAPTNNLHNRRSTADKTPNTRGNTPEHRGHLVLEESLKLLNEANITSDYDHILKPEFDLKDPIVDMIDGTDDYVPIKPDSTGYAPGKADLDDINVPELSKYGLGGVAI